MKYVWEGASRYPTLPKKDVYCLDQATMIRYLYNDILVYKLRDDVCTHFWMRENLVLVQRRRRSLTPAVYWGPARVGLHSSSCLLRKQPVAA